MIRKLSLNIGVCLLLSIAQGSWLGKWHVFIQKPGGFPSFAYGAPLPKPVPLGELRDSKILEKFPLVIGQGEQRLFRIPGLLRYSLGSDSIRAHALSKTFTRIPGHPLPSQAAPPLSDKNNPNDYLLLKGVHPGQADLWVWKSDGSTEHRSIRVEKVTPNELKPSLARALSQLEETEVLLAGGGVVLRGEVLSLSESARVHALSQGYPREVHDETELSASLLEYGKNRLESWISRSEYNSLLRVEIHNKTLFLLGNIEKTIERTSIQKQARALFPPVEIEIASLPDDAPTIYFRVFLLELKRSRFHNMGLSWPASQEGAFRATTGGLQDLLQLDLALQELEGEGSARILSNPELAVRAPGEAELFSGGELPIHSQSRFYSNITWKSFGLTLKLKVTNVAGNRIRLDIFTEVSHLDATIGGDKVPGVQSNRMKTQVDARFGTPLLLSGLLQQGTRQQAQGLPLLRQIPVLGALFGSEDYLNENSELVAILLPSSTPPPAPMHRLKIRELRAPQGPLPPAREWISPSEEQKLRTDPRFPWNALEELGASQ